MQHASFSDKQIQEYLDGVFTGDLPSIEHYLLHTQEGQQRLSVYKLLYETLDNEPSPVLNFSLEDAVINALEKREQQEPVKQWRWLWIPTLVIGIALIIYSFLSVSNFEYLASIVISTTAVGLIVLAVLLLIACHTMDAWQQQKRYKKVLGL